MCGKISRRNPPGLVPGRERPGAVTLRAMFHGAGCCGRDRPALPDGLREGGVSSLWSAPRVVGTGERPITQARVARLLRPFGIRPMKLRFGTTTANGYTKRMFADAWSRYLPGVVEQPITAENDGDERDM